jgi:LmbE family N-acetylglucosaminyl deacetylase
MRALPLATLDSIAPGTSLILAPHADDESLGCGGLIAGLCARGRPPVLVCVTDGAASHPGSGSHPPAVLAAVREDELRLAAAALGLHAGRVHCLGAPDAAVPQTGAGFVALVDAVADLAARYGVTGIFATAPDDPHCDHEATAAIATHAAGRTGARLTYYPVWSWLLPDDRPLPEPRGWRLDIAAELPAKRLAIAAHASQHGGLITDAPDAFRLPAALLKVFDEPYEVFLTP